MRAFAGGPIAYPPGVGNTYYAPGEARADRVKDLFARIASRYDLINDLQSFGLHRRWKRRLVRLSDARPGRKAIDVCCGTGDLALGLARAGAEVVGLDFSEPMLEVARQRAAKCAPAAPGSVRFVTGDALKLPFPDASFDLATVGYGLRNLSDWRGGLAEMNRVTRPGGSLLVLDFGVPGNAWWRRVYFAYLRFAVPLMGRVFCHDADAYAYILESLRFYPAQRGVEACMHEMGGTEVRVINLLGGVMSINLGRRALS